MHPCQIIYQHTNKPIYGNIQGVCRITGEQSAGLNFADWVKPTFTDHAYLKPGTIISNEALFCFDEANEFLAQKAGKTLPQRFRNYTHIVANNIWYVLTKADKKTIFEIITKEPCQLVAIADSGQKHILFKHHAGTWQLEDAHIQPNIPHLIFLNKLMLELQKLNFTQSEIFSGHYKTYKLVQSGQINTWKLLEDQLKSFRGSALFDLAAALLVSMVPATKP